ALAMRGEEFAKDLGPLPPTKVHCTSLVEGALREALAPVGNAAAPAPVAQPAAAPPTLMDAFNKPEQKKSGVKVVFLKP
ncbi:MAG: FeS assembly protein, partial [Verrucomicrobia bacterium]|nr:FeS assembly protein [Verrucomicrobiota bacterium]